MPTLEEATQTVIEVVAQKLDREADSMTAETSLQADLGADSLDIAEIMFGLEEAFGGRGKIDHSTLPTIGSLAAAFADA